MAPSRQFGLLHASLFARFSHYLKPPSIAFRAGKLIALVFGGLLLMQCAGPSQHIQQIATEETPLEITDNTSLSALYLVGRYARQQSDWTRASDVFSEALLRESQSPLFLRQAFFAQYFTGNIEKAAQIARLIEAEGLPLAITSEPAAILAFQQQDYQAVLAFSERLKTDQNTRFMGQLLASWALFAEGQTDAGLSGLRQLGRDLAMDYQQNQQNIDISSQGLPYFIHLHLAEMQILAGRDQEARLELYLLEEATSLAAQIELRQIALWSQLGDPQRSTDIIRYGLSQRFFHQQMIDRLAFNPPVTLNRAMARAVLFLNWVHLTAQNAPLLAGRAHLALQLDPTLDDARFVLAQLAEADGRMDISTDYLASIAEDSPWSGPAFYMQIEQWRQAEDMEKILAGLERKTQNPLFASESLLWQVLGDNYRFDKQYQKAVGAYLASLERGNQLGSVYRSLGIAYEHIGEDKLAEDNLRKAIMLNPEDAYALNYLGYWFADEGRHLDEAFQLIERAVTLRPQNGFFADSLGWVHYRKGQFDQALDWLERAFRLEPSDPVIGDHLGDVYWQLGRYSEARFKWQLVLDIIERDKEAAKDTARIELKATIEQKLVNGL